MSEFGEIANLTFDPDCPGMVDFNASRPARPDYEITISLERIPITFICDIYTAGCLVTTIKDAEPDKFTDRALVNFVLHALLRVNRTFN